MNIKNCDHIGNVHHLAKNTACADDNNNQGEASFYVEVLLPQVSNFSLNQQGVEN
jgi:hypothetical protein